MKKSLFVIVLCLVFLIPIYAQNKDSLYYFEDAISSHVLQQELPHNNSIFEVDNNTPDYYLYDSIYFGYLIVGDK